MMFTPKDPTPVYVPERRFAWAGDKSRPLGNCTSEVTRRKGYTRQELARLMKERPNSKR